MADPRVQGAGLLRAELSIVHARRMAAVFTIAASTILPRTRLAPQWLVASGYAIAIVLLVAVGFFPWARWRSRPRCSS